MIGSPEAARAITSPSPGRPGEARGCRHTPSWRALPGPLFGSVPAEEPQRGDAGGDRPGGEDREIGAGLAEPEPRVLHGGDEVGQWQQVAGVAQARGQDGSGWRGARDEP